jgi:hypothetical protein
MLRAGFTRPQGCRAGYRVELSCAPCGKQVQDLAQALANALHLSGRLRGEWNRGLPFIGFRLGAKLLARAHDGEALLVEQLLDVCDAFYVASAVHTLAGAALYGFELREFALPEAEHVSRQAAQGGNFAYAEVEFVWDENFIRFVLARSLFPGSHVLCAHDRAHAWGANGCTIVTQRGESARDNFESRVQQLALSNLAISRRRIEFDRKHGQWGKANRHL